MLSKIIVSSFQLLIEISIWLVLISAFIGGWQAKGFFGAVGGLIGSFIFCVVFFGAFLILADIQKSVRAIETRQGQG